MLGGALGVADQIKFNYTSVPTFSTTSLGYVNTGTLTNATITTSVQVFYTMPANVPIGVYLVQGGGLLSAFTTNFIAYGSPTSTGMTYTQLSDSTQTGGGSSGVITGFVTGVATITSATNSLTFSANTSGGPNIIIGGFKIAYIRIA